MRCTVPAAAACTAPPLAHPATSTTAMVHNPIFCCNLTHMFLREIRIDG